MQYGVNLILKMASYGIRRVGVDEIKKENYQKELKTMQDLFDGLVAEKKYMKLKDGETRIRIVTDPISGWVYGKEGKPVRCRKEHKPTGPFDPKWPLSAFIACYVWDYDKKDLFVLEIKQASILKPLKGLLTSPDWGEFTGYDIKISRSGTDKETKYGVVPVPPKPMAEEIKKALELSPVRLEALYEGKDPWLDLTAPEGQETASTPIPEVKPQAIDNEQAEALYELIGDDLGLIGRIEDEFKIDTLYSLPAAKLDGVIKRVTEYNKRKLEKAQNGHKEKIA